MSKQIFFLVLGLFFLIQLILVASSLSDNTPSNIQKIEDYNKQQADFYLKNLSFLVAFLVGAISFLSPCSFALIPPFFAYSFKEKKQLVKMTLAFFIGFAPVFVLMGLVASFVGKTIGIFQQSSRALVILGGFILILFGIMTLFGKTFPGFHSDKKIRKNLIGIFLFGALFALGFTACMGPAIFGILVIAGLLKSYFYAGILMLFYSFGLFVPFFLAAFLFDKYNLNKFLSKINSRAGFSITNVAAGLLLIGIGLVFVFYGGTFIVEYLGFGDLSVSNYAFQNKIISYSLSSLIGGGVLVIFILFLWFALRRKDGK